MRPSPKRLALATALTGAAIGTTPALANAASTCTYSPPAGVAAARVDVFDGSGKFPLTVERSGLFIAINDAGGTRLCSGAGTLATVTNTDQIVVHGTSASTDADFFVVDQSAGALAPGKTPESDGNSEIETIITNNSVPFEILDVVGTSGADTMRVSDHGGVMLGNDNDVDIRARDATHVRLEGEGGSDFLSGRGGFPATSPGGATTTVSMFGQAGDDTLVDGPQPNDSLLGDTGNDTLFSFDSNIIDTNFGGADFDTATVDQGDVVNSIERLSQVVGRLKLTPTAITARAGRAARITLAWKHPKSWKRLRSLQLTANDAGNAVGSIRIDPARGRISGHGALRATSRSKVTHQGKWVTARIWLRPSRRLAGRTLRLAVRATDVHGHRQLEPLAGSLTVAE